MYEFIKNMWIMNRITPEKIEIFVTKGFITQQQADEITAIEKYENCEG